MVESFHREPSCERARSGGSRRCRPAAASWSIGTDADASGPPGRRPPGPHRSRPSHAIRAARAMAGLGHIAVPRLSSVRNGRCSAAGEVFTLAGRQTVWMPAGTVSGGLPLELADARPSGFLGRHFAAAHADLRLPARLADWSDHHVLLAMARRGEDLPGNPAPRRRVVCAMANAGHRFEDTGRLSRYPQKRPSRAIPPGHRPAVSGRSSASVLTDGTGSSNSPPALRILWRGAGVTCSSWKRWPSRWCRRTECPQPAPGLSRRLRTGSLKVNDLIGSGIADVSLF